MRELIQREVQRLKMRRELYASLKVDVSPLNKTVILVDDGIATGATILSAIQVVKSLKPKRLICAVPVASSQAIQLIEKEVDELVVLERPREFYSVSQFYDDFEQVSDDQVVQILKRSQAVKNVREKKVQRMEGESFRQRGLDHD
jgi:predicted phosphoribosyltransferase